MGDVGELYRDLKEHHRERRAENLRKADTSGFVRHTPYHFSTTLQGTRLDYWPSGNRWRWSGQTYTGDVHGFIRNRTGIKHHDQRHI